MKRIILTTLLLVMAGAGVNRAGEGTSADMLVWCGLDYSKVKMIGTADFHQPQEIFPGMISSWNALFMKEMLPQLEKMATSVGTDTKAVEALNLKAGPSQIERENGTYEEKVKASHITEADIAKEVRSYDLSHKQGLGVVFIMDRLVKAQEIGCVYVVFFDVSSRKVIHSERLAEKAGGMGFRNYWFNPVKLAVRKLPNSYRQAKVNRAAK